ncbi:O-antigen ligase family protein [Marinococcus halotolerans]|uniref:O-antigen ligase family protein n=1 Tax=Marinococcus halotolerans TaxID=301092 RepID=UPI0003B7B0D7|nr:O-antigen ligase family protein [Marinococcus halotolerans]
MERATSLRFENIARIVLLTYLLVQPVLDLLIFFDTPFASQFRALFIGAGLIYLYFFSTGWLRKLLFIYIPVLFVYFAINFGVNYFVKDPYFLSIEMTNIVKSIYFPIIVFTYLTFIYQQINEGLHKKIIPYILGINMLLIGVVVFLADITGTGRRAYGFLAKEGHTGWFFSGNEISAITAMGFPFVVLVLMKTEKLWKKIAVMAGALLIVWAMMTLGTKVAFVGLIAGLVLGVIYAIIMLFQRRYLNFVLLAVVFILTAVATPAMPIGNNLGLAVTESMNEEPEPAEEEEESASAEEQSEDTDNKESKSEESKSEESTGEDAEEPKEEEPNEEILNTINSIPYHSAILSGREEHLAEAFHQLNEAPVVQKIVGMGVYQNYPNEEAAAPIEMDLFDWFFDYGFIGLLILTFPIFLTAYLIIRNLLKYKMAALNIYFFFGLISMGLGISASIIAGHILYYPAAAIYLAVAMALTVKYSEPEQNNLSFRSRNKY